MSAYRLFCTSASFFKCIPIRRELILFYTVVFRERVAPLVFLLTVPPFWLSWKYLNFPEKRCWRHWRKWLSHCQTVTIITKTKEPVCWSRSASECVAFIVPYTYYPPHSKAVTLKLWRSITQNVRTSILLFVLRDTMSNKYIAQIDNKNQGVRLVCNTTMVIQCQDIAVMETTKQHLERYVDTPLFGERGFKG